MKTIFIFVKGHILKLFTEEDFANTDGISSRTKIDQQLTIERLKNSFEAIFPQLGEMKKCSTNYHKTVKMIIGKKNNTYLIICWIFSDEVP